MTKKCNKCRKEFNVHIIPSEEFTVEENEKFCYPGFIENKKYISFKCDRCRTINSYII